MQKIRCVVERITYQNPENGYSVLKCRVKDYSELVPVIGNMIDANVGSVLVCEGNWKVDAKYGRQFVAENWEETLPLPLFTAWRNISDPDLSRVSDRNLQRRLSGNTV